MGALGKVDRIVCNKILDLPKRPVKFVGLVGLYRRPPAEQLQAGAEALRRIARVSDNGDTPILPRELRDAPHGLSVVVCRRSNGKHKRKVT